MQSSSIWKVPVVKEFYKIINNIQVSYQIKRTQSKKEDKRLWI